MIFVVEVQRGDGSWLVATDAWGNELVMRDSKVAISEAEKLNCQVKSDCLRVRRYDVGSVIWSNGDVP